MRTMGTSFCFCHWIISTGIYKHCPVPLYVLELLVVTFFFTLSAFFFWGSGVLKEGYFCFQFTDY